MGLLAIASAQKTLRIENAYFLPDDLMRKELTETAKRGAKVEVVVPGKKIDQELVRLASRRHWPELIRAGVRIFEYEPTTVHVKLMIVDDIFVSVGSGNFDNRSIRLNDEANLDVLDRSFVAQQIRLFESDKKQCREVTLDKTGGLISPIRFNRRPGSLLRSCRGARRSERLYTRLPAMKRGMTFLHCSESAPARRTNFFVCAQGSLHRRSIIG